MKFGRFFGRCVRLPFDSRPEERSLRSTPASFRGRYQDALRELVETKTKALATALRAIAEPPQVVNSSGCAIIASSRRFFPADGARDVSTS
jgi:hypothetical protein